MSMHTGVEFGRLPKGCSYVNLGPEDTGYGSFSEKYANSSRLEYLNDFEGQGSRYLRGVVREMLASELDRFTKDELPLLKAALANWRKYVCIADERLRFPLYQGDLIIGGFNDMRIDSYMPEDPGHSRRADIRFVGLILNTVYLNKAMQGGRTCAFAEQKEIARQLLRTEVEYEDRRGDISLLTRREIHKAARWVHGG